MSRTSRGPHGADGRRQAACRRPARRYTGRTDRASFLEDPMAVSSLDRLGASRRRSVLALAAAGVAVLLVILGAAAYLYDHSRRDVIAKGVRIDGVPVGGLHEAAARAKVEHDLVTSLHRPVTVRFGGRS